VEVSPKDYSQSRSVLASSGPSAIREHTTEPSGQRNDFPPEGDAPMPPTPPGGTKGEIVNAGIQVLGAAAGNLAGGATNVAGTAAAKAAGGATTKVAASAAAEADALGAAATSARSGAVTARDTVRDGAQGLIAQVAEAGDAGGEQTWGQYGRQARRAARKATRQSMLPSAAEVDPVSEDDRTGYTKARDSLKEATGVDADEAVGAIAGGAAGAAMLASGVGAVASGAVGAFANTLGTGLARATHAVGSVHVKVRKNMVAIGFAAVGTVMLAMMTVLTGGAAQQQAAAQEESVVIAALEQARLQAQNASVLCAVEQEFPLGHVYGPRVVANAQTIHEVAQSRGLPMYASVIATAIAFRETGLLGSTHPGRAGVFGFSPGAAGSAVELSDVAYSAGVFFDRLDGISGWRAMTVDEVGRVIMGGVFSNKYSSLEGASREILNQGGIAAGAGCEARGVPLACPEVPELEADDAVMTRDARELVRCLWHLGGLRDITVSGGGHNVAIGADGAVDVLAALEEPSDDPTQPFAGFSPSATLSWLSATFTTFGIDTVEASDVRATFLPASTSPDAPRFAARVLAAGSTQADVIKVRVHGSAGTGVVAKANGPWVRPAPDGCAVRSEWGYRIHPIYGTRKLHEGMDFGCGSGTQVYAASSGTVARQYWSTTGGNILVIDHGDGVTTHYLHLSSFIVGVGMPVQSGEVVALSGNTGSATTGAHLHFEVRVDGASVNPRDHYASMGSGL